MSNIRPESTYTPNPVEARRLAAARHGNSKEFGELAEPYRRELRVHCYRILGSLHDAEDMVQETMLRAWRRLDTYEGRASFRAWLYKIATNACLDLLDQRRRRAKRLLPQQLVSPADPDKPLDPPATEILWLEPLPDEWLADSSAANPEVRYSTHESISLAFLVALQILPPRHLRFSLAGGFELVAHRLTCRTSSSRFFRVGIAWASRGYRVGKVAV